MKDRILNTCMLLTVAAALILTLTRGAPEPADSGVPFAVSVGATAAPAATPAPLEAYRLRREQTRREEREALQALIQSEATADELRALAEQQLLDMTRHNEIELAVEAALTAKGCGDGLCAARRDGVTVFLPWEISAQDAALLLDIVREVSGLSKENIRLTGM